VTAKRQHFIPCLHLKHFAGTEPNGHVWTYDAELGTARSALPRETGVESHFYSFLNTEGYMDTRIEQHLSVVESKAASVYERLLQDIVPGETQERADFANFLALMHVRTPAVRRMMAEVVSHSHQVRSYVCATNNKLFDSFIRSFQEDGGSLTEEEISHIRSGMIDPGGYILEIPKELTLNCLEVSDELTPLFFKMNWSLVRPRHSFFITSDNPVVRMVNPYTRHPAFGDLGFYNKTAVVMFPLSPQMLLRLSWERVPARFVIEREHVTHLNRKLAAHSERYLYAHLLDKRLKKLAAEFKDKRPAIAVTTSGGLRPEKFAETRLRRRSTRS